MVRAFQSKKTIIAAFGLAVGPFLLAGCGGGDSFQEAIGYYQAGPDEMAVIKRPPLIVPPDYNLRPPRSGDRATAGNAASAAARRTLVGPDAVVERGEDDARALLTGVAPENGTADAEASSEGQAFLVSRTDRTEGTLDELAETRAENRVDGALLRRLLAWTPDDRPAAAETEAGEDEAGGDDGEEAVVIQVVSRSQTVIDDQANAE